MLMKHVHSAFLTVCARELDDHARPGREADPSVLSVHVNWTIMLNLAVSVLGLAG